MGENITVEPLLSIAGNDNELHQRPGAPVAPPIEAFGTPRRLEQLFTKRAATRRDREPPANFAQRLFKKAKTSSGWASAFLTVGQCLTTSPFGPITTVERMVPCTSLPYIIFLP